MKKSEFVASSFFQNAQQISLVYLYVASRGLPSFNVVPLASRVLEELYLALINPREKGAISLFIYGVSNIFMRIKMSLGGRWRMQMRTHVSEKKTYFQVLLYFSAL